MDDAKRRNGVKVNNLSLANLHPEASDKRITITNISLKKVKFRTQGNVPISNISIPKHPRFS